MDNLTHSLLGLTAAKAGLEKLSPGASVLCILAANAPDSDIIVLAFGDRWTFLQHHRGITHAIVGVLVIAVILPLLFYAFDRLWARFRNRPPQVNLRGLLIASLIVSATHPLLDWTNNYGIRFFLPWSEHWSYGDLVFIVDPFLWLVLGGASFLLSKKGKSQKIIWGGIATLLTFLIVASPRSGSLPNPSLIMILWILAIAGLIALYVIGAKERWGNRIAFFAFALVLGYWCVLGLAHRRALITGGEAAAMLASANGESVARFAAMPTLANMLRWDCVFETERATYRFSLNLTDENITKPIRYVKTPELIEVVSRQRPARVFLGFARFPVAQLEDPGCTTRTLVQLADLRYTEPGKTRGSFSLEVPVECPVQQ